MTDKPKQSDKYLKSFEEELEMARIFRKKRAIGKGRSSSKRPAVEGQ